MSDHADKILLVTYNRTLIQYIEHIFVMYDMLYRMPLPSKYQNVISVARIHRL